MKDLGTHDPADGSPMATMARDQVERIADLAARRVCIKCLELIPEGKGVRIVTSMRATVFLESVGGAAIGAVEDEVSTLTHAACAADGDSDFASLLEQHAAHERGER